MKLIFRTAALAALIIIASCGKDDSPSTPNEIDQIAEEQEQTPLETNLIADNVIIAGGTKNTGTPPAPNEGITLDISDASKTAFLNEGFDIPFSSDGDVIGAYLQFKSNDGIVSDSYYDINVSTNSAGKTILNKNNSKRRVLRHATKVNGGILDIDFNAQIEPGTFCYLVCVYDANGNISLPQEVCLTVESWGGNSNLVGTWKLTKEVHIASGSTITRLVNEENCAGEKILECDSGSTFTAETWCYISNESTFIFNADGTYELEWLGKEKQLLVAESIASCSSEYLEYSDNETSKGQWAYLKEKDKFILFEYYASYDVEGETFIEESSPGEAYPFIEDSELDIFNVENGVLIWGWEDTADGFKAYYEKP